jgi:hypothetical protein
MPAPFTRHASIPVSVFQLLGFDHEIGGDFFESVRGCRIRADAGEANACLREPAEIFNNVHNRNSEWLFEAVCYDNRSVKTCDLRTEFCVLVPKATRCRRGYGFPERLGLAEGPDLPWRGRSARGVRPVQRRKACENALTSV